MLGEAIWVRVPRWRCWTMGQDTTWGHHDEGLRACCHRGWPGDHHKVHWPPGLQGRVVGWSSTVPPLLFTGRLVLSCTCTLRVVKWISLPHFLKRGTERIEEYNSVRQLAALLWVRWDIDGWIAMPCATAVGIGVWEMRYGLGQRWRWYRHRKSRREVWGRDPRMI